MREPEGGRQETSEGNQETGEGRQETEDGKQETGEGSMTYSVAELGHFGRSRCETKQNKRNFE